VKHQNIIFILFVYLLCLVFTGCSKVVLKMYGISNPVYLNDKDISRCLKDFNIPISDAYKLDTSYMLFLQEFDSTLYSQERNNHYQPLQVLYYNNKGQLMSFHVNCYAGGFPNLKWNSKNQFSNFPPGQQAQVDSLLPLNIHLKFLKSVSDTSNEVTAGYDYYVIVYWNRFMGRQSKRFIQLVQENLKRANDKKVQIFYVNNDNIFAAAISKQ